MTTVISKTLARPSAETCAPTGGRGVQTMTFSRKPGQAAAVVFGPKGFILGRPAMGPETLTERLVRLKDAPDVMEFADDEALMSYLDRK